jgi:hypothetical protein
MVLSAVKPRKFGGELADEGRVVYLIGGKSGPFAWQQKLLRQSTTVRRNQRTGFPFAALMLEINKSAVSGGFHSLKA